MKVLEDSDSFYKVRHTQWQVFFVTLFGIVFGFLFYPHNNIVGIVSNLIGVGALFLPIRRELILDKANKKLIISVGGILGKRNKEYAMKDIKKFTITGSKKSLSFNLCVFSEMGFIENRNIFPAGGSRGSFYFTGYTPQGERMNIPNYAIFKKIADLCNKELVYEDSYELAKQMTNQIGTITGQIRKSDK